MKTLLVLATMFAATLGFGQTAPTATVTLTWNSVAPVISKYNVYRSNVPGGPFVQVGNSGNAATVTFAQSFLLTASTQEYYYVVRSLAVDGLTESTNSKPWHVTIPALSGQPPAPDLKTCVITISPAGAVSGTCQ